MPRKLLVLNALFLAVVALAAASISRQILTPRPLPGPARAPAVAATPPQADSPAPPPTAYAVVAARNLFSPTRTETATELSATPVIVAKPNLYGIVLRQGKPSVAYLEDPLSRRVNPYRIGDPVSGGKLLSIKRDSVTIERADGKFDVALRDPAKPRPAAATGPGAPATPVTAPGPGVLPGVLPRLPLPVLPTPGQTPTLQPRAQTTPPAAREPATAESQGRRLPFNFLRRLPQPPPAPGAPTQGQQD